MNLMKTFRSNISHKDTNTAIAHFKDYILLKNSMITKSQNDHVILWIGDIVFHDSCILLHCLSIKVRLSLPVKLHVSVLYCMFNCCHRMFSLLIKIIVYCVHTTVQMMFIQFPQGKSFCHWSMTLLQENKQEKSSC